jgi:hypothetical protein
VRLRKALLDHLPSRHQIGPRIKDEPDRRQPIDGLGLDGLEPGHAVQEVRLQPKRDKLLDLDRRQAERLGLNFDIGVGELGERVYGDVPKCQASEEENQAGDTQDQ